MKGEKIGFCLREFVNVQSRTWPGINKPGGVGRITKIDPVTNTVCVKYVLGGSEKNVDVKYCSTIDTNAPLVGSPTRKRKVSCFSPGAKIFDRTPSPYGKHASPTVERPTEEMTATSSQPSPVAASPEPHQSIQAAKKKQIISPEDPTTSSTQSEAFVPTPSCVTKEGFPFSLSEFVVVQSRTWPGVNKPGGVGQILKIDYAKRQVEVKYVLGGREKGVSIEYCTPKDQVQEQKRESIKTDFFHDKIIAFKASRRPLTKEETARLDAARKKKLEEIKSLLKAEKQPLNQKTKPIVVAAAVTNEKTVAQKGACGDLDDCSIPAVVGTAESEPCNRASSSGVKSISLISNIFNEAMLPLKKRKISALEHLSSTASSPIGNYLTDRVCKVHHESAILPETSEMEDQHLKELAATQWKQSQERLKLAKDVIVEM
eukprot:Stramenopile-MAST_4_protein_1823